MIIGIYSEIQILLSVTNVNANSPRIPPQFYCLICSICYNDLTGNMV